MKTDKQYLLKSLHNLDNSSSNFLGVQKGLKIASINENKFRYNKIAAIPRPFEDQRQQQHQSVSQKERPFELPEFGKSF